MDAHPNVKSTHSFKLRQTFFDVVSGHSIRAGIWVLIGIVVYVCIPQFHAALALGIGIALVHLTIGITMGTTLAVFSLIQAQREYHASKS